MVSKKKEERTRLDRRLSRRFPINCCSPQSGFLQGPLWLGASLPILLGDGCTRGRTLSPPSGQGWQRGPSYLGRVTVLPLALPVQSPPHPPRRLSSGATEPVPGARWPGRDLGDPASEGREEPGSRQFSSSAAFSRWLTASPGAGASPLRLARWGGMAASAWLEAGLARVLFYPTLLYTVFRGRVSGPAHRDWYHRIDRTVLLGALPLRSMTRRVREAAGPGRERAPGLGGRPGALAEPPLCFGSW